MQEHRPCGAGHGHPCGSFQNHVSSYYSSSLHCHESNTSHLFRDGLLTWASLSPWFHAPAEAYPFFENQRLPCGMCWNRVTSEESNATFAKRKNINREGKATTSGFPEKLKNIFVFYRFAQRTIHRRVAQPLSFELINRRNLAHGSNTIATARWIGKIY